MAELGTIGVVHLFEFNAFFSSSDSQRAGCVHHNAFIHIFLLVTVSLVVFCKPVVLEIFVIAAFSLIAGFLVPGFGMGLSLRKHIMLQDLLFLLETFMGTPYSYFLFLVILVFESVSDLYRFSCSSRVISVFPSLSTELLQDG